MPQQSGLSNRVPETIHNRLCYPHSRGMAEYRLGHRANSWFFALVMIDHCAGPKAVHAVPRINHHVPETTFRFPRHATPYRFYSLTSKLRTIIRTNKDAPPTTPPLILHNWGQSLAPPRRHLVRSDIGRPRQNLGRYWRHFQPESWLGNPRPVSRLQWIYFHDKINYKLSETLIRRSRIPRILRTAVLADES